MAIVKTAWVYLWIAAAATEVGLSALFHSFTFLEIGGVASLMVAFNLQRRIRTAARMLTHPA
jgi:hypothetical protein